jgi:hypothetical protein
MLTGVIGRRHMANEAADGYWGVGPRLPERSDSVGDEARLKGAVP